tara:strand:+ start:2973 stop:3821 length:849 start_codon:yes stop_codon:yes gene_type:complete
MIDNEIIGGVSPLKKRRSRKSIRKQNQKRDIKGKKAGKHGMLNTRTKRGGLLGRVFGGGRGGFSEAGAAGVNPHGYGSRTRFKYNKAAAGPLAPATSSKTGPTSGGGGPNPYPIDSGDTIYNTTTTDNSVDNSRGDFFYDKSITDKSKNINTTGDAKNIAETEQSNRTKQNIKSNQEIESETKSSGGGFREACHDANGKRLPSGSVGTDSNGKRFKCVWDPNYKPRSKSRSKNRNVSKNKNVSKSDQDAETIQNAKSGDIQANRSYDTGEDPPEVKEIMKSW